VTASSPEPAIFRHSLGWSIARAGLAFTLVAYAWGAAYEGTASRRLLALLLAAAAIIALSGAAYVAFVLSRQQKTVTRLALAPVAVAANVFTLLLAVAAASDLRW